MAGQTGIAANPFLALLPPDQQQTYAQLQQRQAIGQALLSQGLQPLDPGNQTVGGMAYHVSPLNGVAKLLNAYVGNKLSMDAAGQQAQLTGQMYGGAFGGAPAQSSAAAPAAQAPDAGGIAGGGSGDGVQSFPVQTSGAQPSGQQLGAALTNTPAPSGGGGPLTLPGYTPQQSMQLFATLGPDAYGKLLESRTAPTDATRMAWAAGVDPSQANAGALFKANYVAPITGTGTFRDPRTMQPVAFNPEIPAGTNALYDASGNVAAVQPIAGAQAAMQGNAAAAAAGSAQFKPVQVYNPQTHQMEYSNEAAVTNPSSGGNGALPGIVNNNPGNLRDPKTGNFQTFGTQQAGINAADQNLLAYQTQHGINTLNGITARWAPKGDGNNDPVAYAQAVAQATGIAPDQKIDLTNPAVRGKVLQAMFDVETPGWRGAQNGASQPTGAPAAAPPLGATANANTAQEASAQSMKNSYARLQASNSNAGAALDALQKMQQLASQKSGVFSAGALGTAVAPLVSPGAAEYEKQRANVISLLSAQNGTNGSDAGRALTGESVPDYGKPNQAIQDGLGTLANQVRAQQLKSNFLTPIYQQGDSKAYTTAENDFDQNVKPSMMPVLSLSGDAQRAAVQAAIKSNPALRSNFEWAFNNGLLK